MLASILHAESSPGRASEEEKQAAQKLLGTLKCPAFSPMDLHNGFPSMVKVGRTHVCSRAEPTLHCNSGHYWGL